MPITLDNRYANRVGEVDWVFRVDGFNETQLTVTKNWSDGNASHANDSVTVKLLKDGKETGTTQVLNAANNWTYTFDKLDADSTWTVEEEAGRRLHPPATRPRARLSPSPTPRMIPAPIQRLRWTSQ